MQRARLPYILIPLAAFIAVLPLLIHGCSCGHDFDFHVLSWMEAARQFAQGDLHPHWAYTPAWNAGEPRFIFYPPLSWTIGAILGLIFPWTWTPIIYTWLALTAAGFGLYYLARDFAASTAATLAAIFYTVNPYMLFTAYERTAYAELLAAAWVPLLLHAILRQQVTIPRIAVPIALLWLTNAPAAVMSCYALALLTIIRLAESVSQVRTTRFSSLAARETVISTEATHGSIVSRVVEKPASLFPPRTNSPTVAPPQTPLHLALNTIAGTALGLGLAAFYVLPAAYERRYVQIAMAIIPNMRIQDNFLFHHTTDVLHDQVLHTASLIAVFLIATTTLFITTIALLHHNFAKRFESLAQTESEKDASSRPNPERASRVEGGVERPPHFVRPHTPFKSGTLLTSLAILTIAITLLLTPLSAFIWNHAPELVFLQFPWRILAVLAAVLGLTIALALTPLSLKPASITAITLATAAALTYPAYTVFHQTCDAEDTVHARLALFHSNQGTDPTDEYTPVPADNDSLAHTDPPYWLSPDPNAKPTANAAPGPAPTHLTLNSPVPEDIILNLRDYPVWHITLNGTPVTTHIQRDDGLITLPISAGPSTIDINYARMPDQTVGDLITAIALITLTVLLGRRTKNII
jgi:hypothetical protein